MGTLGLKVDVDGNRCETMLIIIHKQVKFGQYAWEVFGYLAGTDQERASVMHLLSNSWLR